MFLDKSGSTRIAENIATGHPYHFTMSNNVLYAVCQDANDNGLLYVSTDNGVTWTLGFNYGQCTYIAVRGDMVAVTNDFQVMTAMVSAPESITYYSFLVPMNGHSPTFTEYRPTPPPGSPQKTYWYGIVSKAIPFPERAGCLVSIKYSSIGVMTSGYVLFSGGVSSYTFLPPSGLSNTSIVGIIGQGGNTKILIMDYDPFHSSSTWEAVLNLAFTEEGRVDRDNFSPSTHWEGFTINTSGVSAAIPYVVGVAGQPQGRWQQGLSTAPVKIDDVRSDTMTPISTLSSGEESVRCVQGEVNGTLTIALIDPIMTFSYTWGDDLLKSIGSQSFKAVNAIWMPPSSPVFGIGVHATEQDNTKSLYWVYDMAPHVMKRKPIEYYSEQPQPDENVGNLPDTDPGPYPYHSGSSNIAEMANSAMRIAFQDRKVDRW